MAGLKEGGAGPALQGARGGTGPGIIQERLLFRAKVDLHANIGEEGLAGAGTVWVSRDQVVVIKGVLYPGKESDPIGRTVASREIEQEVALGLAESRVRGSRAVDQVSSIAGGGEHLVHIGSVDIEAELAPLETRSYVEG